MASGFEKRDEKIRRMRKLGPAIRREVRKAMAKNAAELEEGIRYAAPEDDGDLKESVTSRDRSNATRISAQVSAGDQTAFYARMVEFGTPRQAAQPFFYPIIRARRKRNKSRLTRAANKGIKQALNNG